MSRCTHPARMLSTMLLRETEIFLWTALDHQLQDGLMGQQEFDRTRFIVRKLWDLKLQNHMIEKEGTQLSDVIGHVITLTLHLFSEGIITRSLFVYVCTHWYTR